LALEKEGTKLGLSHVFRGLPRTFAPRSVAGTGQRSGLCVLLWWDLQARTASEHVKVGLCPLGGARNGRSSCRILDSRYGPVRAESGMATIADATRCETIV